MRIIIVELPRYASASTAAQQCELLGGFMQLPLIAAVAGEIMIDDGEIVVLADGKKGQP